MYTYINIVFKLVYSDVLYVCLSCDNHVGLRTESGLPTDLYVGSSFLVMTKAYKKSLSTKVSYIPCNKKVAKLMKSTGHSVN